MSEKVKEVGGEEEEGRRMKWRHGFIDAGAAAADDASTSSAGVVG